VRECRAIPVYSSLLVRFYHYQARTRLRVQRAPGIPHALHFYFSGGETFISDSGALRVARGNVFVEFTVIASAAKIQTSGTEVRRISIHGDHQQQLSFRGALLREPGIHNPCSGYGFRACASGRLSPTEGASRNDE
jgi:hypothetical protein